MLARADASFAELGLRARLHLARALTEAAQHWLDEPALPEGTVQAHRPAWLVHSVRDGGEADRLRAVLPDALSAEAFVAEAFRVVLGRAPDAHGMAGYTGVLGRDPGGRGCVLDSLAGSAEAGRTGERFRFSRCGPPTPS